MRTGDQTETLSARLMQITMPQDNGAAAMQNAGGLVGTVLSVHPNNKPKQCVECRPHAASIPHLHWQPSGRRSFWQLKMESPVSASSSVPGCSRLCTCLNSTCMG